MNSDTHLPVVSYCPLEVASRWVVAAPALIPICTRADCILRRNFISLGVLQQFVIMRGPKWYNFGILQKRVLLRFIFITKKV